jgi:hypothetical protein
VELVAQRGRRPPAILPRSEWLARAAHQRLIASTGGCSSWAASAHSRAPADGLGIPLDAAKIGNYASALCRSIMLPLCRLCCYYADYAPL